MAYAAVASLSHTIHLLLNYHQHSISPILENQMISIQKHTIFLEWFLERFPDRANNWEETIREVSDRAEDIIELLLSDSLLKSKSIVGSSRSKFEKGKYVLHYGFDELERVTEEMESIVNGVKGRRRTEAMGGSDEELMKIISRLRGGSSALEIIPIVGVGGIGKTTLATKAYFSPLIKDHFDVHAWSTVSTNRSLPDIISDVLHSMNSMGLPVSVNSKRSKKLLDSASSLNSEIRSLYNNLCGRRFLILLDDVWYPEALDGLKNMLPDDGNGSRIILTTRSFQVARSAGHIHEMSLLDEDQTWNLVRRKIFKGDPCPSQLESIGKDIARSCRGNRLCIEVVSGILAADQTEATWEDVSDNLKLASEHGESDLPLKILSQSYRYLPHHLRPCFLYLVIFPKDDEILVSKLIKLWIAEGFLNQSECKSFEETGEEFLKDLVRRSLVSVSGMKSNGRIKNIKIHDLVREFCLRQAQTDNFIHHVEISNRFPVAGGLKRCRRVSDIIYDDDFLEGVDGSTIRTIMLNYSSALGVQFSIGNVKLLRILDSSNAYLYDLPEEVFELFHLRYLAFNSGFSISEAISNLENLQTLIIRLRGKVFKKFGELPEGIWRMPQLRHLIVFHFKLPSPKGATPPLENLQTLYGVVNFICSRENLKMIPNLKKLAIFYFKNSGDVVEDYQLDNLIYLHKVEILKIEMNWFSFMEERKMMSKRCVFPPTLKKLKLCGVQLPWEDMKIVASLPNLQVLKLGKNACIGETWETSEGGFPQLRYLVIVESNLVNWITESSHFPRLNYLILRCLSLLEVPSDMGNIPTLRCIALDRRSTLSLLCSAKQIQEDLQSSGDDRLRIQIL